MAELALSVLPENRVHLIDSKPLPVVNPKSPSLGKRATWAGFPDAARGFSTMGMVFGFKLHALTSMEGLFERWAFAAANHADVTLAKELMEGLEEEVIVGDKAYIGIGVLTPARSNMTGDGVWTEQLSRARKRIESSFSSLVRSLTLHAAQVKTFLSLTRRVRLWRYGLWPEPPQGRSHSNYIPEQGRTRTRPSIVGRAWTEATP